MFITNSFSLSWRSSDSFRSSWAWCSLASTSCCWRSFCFTTLSMCWKESTKSFYTACKSMVIWQVQVSQKQPLYLLSQFILFIKLLQLFRQLAVLMSEAGVPLVVLLHLSLDVVQCRLKMGCDFFPFLLLQTCSLHAFILLRGESNATKLKPLERVQFRWDEPVSQGGVCTLSVRLCRCNSLHRLSSLLRARMALLCSFLRLSLSWISWFCFFCSVRICFWVLRCSSSCHKDKDEGLSDWQRQFITL